MTFRSFVVGSMVLVALAGCGQQMQGDALAYTDAEPTYRSAALSDPRPEELESLRVGGSSARRLIKTAALEILVADPERTSAEVQEITASLGGHVASLKAWKPAELFHYQLTLRVPENRLEEALRRIKEIAEEVVSESLDSRDVTEQVVDLEARIRTLRATEAELRTLLAASRERDFDAEDVMAVYKHLTGIRGEIESAEGKLRGLDDLATLSTVNLALLPTEAAKPVVAASWRPKETARKSTRLLLALLRRAGDLAIVFFIVILPLTLLAGLVLWPLRQLVARARRRSQEAQEAIG